MHSGLENYYCVTRSSPAVDTSYTSFQSNNTQKKIQLTHLPHIPACCVCPCLHACFPPSCCITEVCLHARSEDPAVCACVFAILFGCLPLFARMNTNLAEFLMARDAVVSKIFTLLPPFTPTPPCFLQSPKTDTAVLLAAPPTRPRVILFV